MCLRICSKWLVVVHIVYVSLSLLLSLLEINGSVYTDMITLGLHDTRHIHSSYFSLILSICSFKKVACTFLRTSDMSE